MIRELFPGTRALLSRGEAGGLRIISESAERPGVHAMETMSWADPRSNRFVFECPAAEAWLRHRRAHRVEVRGETVGDRWLADLGHRLDRSVHLHEGMYGAKMRGFMVLSPTLPDGGDVLLTVGHERAAGAARRRGAAATVLVSLGG